MTEAERQTVIDALELWGTDDVSQEDYENAKQALAIMRREREPVAWRLRIGDSDVWSYADTESDADFWGRQSGLKYAKEPLYKD